MSKNAIFVKTAKAEYASANLSIDLKRVLSYMDGKSRSDDLAKRAPPSLRNQWNELLKELVEGEYIVFNGKAKIEENFLTLERGPKAGFDNKQAIVAKANDSCYPSLSAAEQVVAELEAAAAALEAASHVAAKAADIPEHNFPSGRQVASAATRVVAELESAAAAAKSSQLDTHAKVNTEALVAAKAKAATEEKQKLEKAARAAELKAFFAAAKEKANAEVKQIAKDAARVRAEQESVAAAKAKLAAVAEANAEAARKTQEASRARAEREAAAKAKLEASAQVKLDAKRKEKEASRAQLESAVAAAKARSAAQAQARAAAKQREQETAQACAEVEAAILATKVTSDVRVDIWGGAEAAMPLAKSGRKYIGDPRPYVWRARSGEVQTGDTKRLHDLEIENECLMKLLTDAYVEIETLKVHKS